MADELKLAAQLKGRCILTPLCFFFTLQSVRTDCLDWKYSCPDSEPCSAKRFLLYSHWWLFRMVICQNHKSKGRGFILMLNQIFGGYDWFMVWSIASCDWHRRTHYKCFCTQLDSRMTIRAFLLCVMGFTF